MNMLGEKLMNFPVLNNSQHDASWTHEIFWCGKAMHRNFKRFRTEQTMKPNSPHSEKKNPLNLICKFGWTNKKQTSSQDKATFRGDKLCFKRLGLIPNHPSVHPPNQNMTLSHSSHAHTDPIHLSTSVVICKQTNWLKQHWPAEPSHHLSSEPSAPSISQSFTTD